MSDNTEETEKKVALIGWIALWWNAIEDTSHMALACVLGVNNELYRDLCSRIHGFDGVAELLKKSFACACADHAQQGVLEPVNAAIDFAKQIKLHRDNVVHTMPDFGTDIGTTRKSRGRLVRISISNDALQSIHDHCALATDAIICVAKIAAAVSPRYKPIIDESDEGDYFDLAVLTSRLKDILAERRTLASIPAPAA